MKIDKEYALKSLNLVFSHLIHPVQLKQGRQISPEQFRKWLATTEMSAVERLSYTELLDGLNKSDEYTAVLLHDVKVRNKNKKIEAVLIAPFEKLKNLKLLADLYLIAALSTSDVEQQDRGQMEFCKYNTCFCSSPSNCSCVSASSPKDGSEPCRGSSCSSAADCGDGTSDPGDDTANVIASIF